MNKIVVITGATSGIGAELFALYSSRGDTVINLSRSACEPNGIAVDVTHTDELRAAVESIVNRYGRIDEIVANAGLGLSGATELISEQSERYQFDVNFFGAVEFIKACLPHMSSGGKVVVISSACALFSLPFRAYYCASKSAVRSLAEGLYMELKPHGIKVTCICPGDIKSNFSANRVKVTSGGRYGDAPTKAAEKIDSREHKRMDVKTASKKIFAAATKCNKPIVIIGAKYKLFNVAARLLPRKTFLNLTAKFFG